MADEISIARNIINKHKGYVYGIYIDELAKDLALMVSYDPGIVNLVFSQLQEQGYDSNTIIGVARAFLDKTNAATLGILAKTLHGSTLIMTIHRIIKCDTSSNATAQRCIKIQTALVVREEEKIDVSTAFAFDDGTSVRIETAGLNGRRNFKVYQANKSGMIDVRDLSTNPASKFLVADGQSVPEEYLSVRSAAALFNVALSYNKTFTSDNKLIFTAGSASNGAPGICGGAPCHKTHQQGSCVDLRYMDSSGKDIKGDKAYETADIQRTLWLIKAFEKIGFSKIYTGDNTRFGIADKTPKSRDGVEKVHRHHLHVGYM